MSFVVAFDQSRRHCACTEPKPFKDFNEPQSWFSPKPDDLTVTFCAFCVTHLQLDKRGPLYPVPQNERNNLLQINCDAGALHPSLMATSKGPFQVFVCSTKHTIPYYLSLDNLTKASDGFGVIRMPTQADYELIIMLDDKKRQHGSNECFVVESITVGERKVKVFEANGDVFVTKPLHVTGFTPNGTDSFKFVSVTKHEKEAKLVDAEVLANYNEDNKIRIKLQRYRCTPFVPPSRSYMLGETEALPCWGLPSPAYNKPRAGAYGGNGSLSMSMPGAYGSSSSSSSPSLGAFKKLSDPGRLTSSARPPPEAATESFLWGAGGEIKLQGKINTFERKTSAYSKAAEDDTFACFGSMSLGSSSSAASSDNYSSMDFLGGGPPLVPVKEALTGGTTISGGQKVIAPKTAPTRDTYTKIGEAVEIVLQLTCFQTDAEKEVDNDRAAMHEDGYDYWMGQRKKLEDAHKKSKEEWSKLLARMSAEFEQVQKKLEVAVVHCAALAGPDGYLLHVPLIDPDEITATVKRH